jgi:hypothetical protein
MNNFNNICVIYLSIENPLEWIDFCNEVFGLPR